MVFEKIYKQFYPKVFRLCMGYVNAEAQAKDLVQETFITVWEKLPSFRNESGIGTWIFRIASNNCLRTIEKENRFPKAEMPVQLQEINETNNDEKLQLLYRFISELEEADRIICSLMLEGLPQAEIASVIGISDGNTRVRIHRIKEKLTLKFKLQE